MCTNPQTKDGYVFSCKKCDECLESRRNTWVARAMAERAVFPNILALMLSYRNNADGTAPDAAVTFNYKHVELFVKRVRRAYSDRYGKTSQVSFVVAGEKGSDNDRVHWHLVFFAKEPLEDLGEWETLSYKPLEEIQYDKNVHWTYWRHGFVHPQRPDQGGVFYCLKYAVKDQFTPEASKGTARYTKSRTHAATMFRMSKFPPLGMRYLEALVDGWRKDLRCPPDLRIRIPDYTGYWYPAGKFREYLLESIYEINQRRIQLHGAPCPQFHALCCSVVSSEKDWETLQYGPLEEEEEPDRDVFEFEDHIGSPAAQVRRRCGGLRPCNKCFRAWKGTPDFSAFLSEQGCEYITTDPLHNLSFDRWYRRKYEINPFCNARFDDDTKACFERRTFQVLEGL